MIVEFEFEFECNIRSSKFIFAFFAFSFLFKVNSFEFNKFSNFEFDSLLEINVEKNFAKTSIMISSSSNINSFVVSLSLN